MADRFGISDLAKKLELYFNNIYERKVGGSGSLTIGSGEAGVDYTLTFDGESNDGVITWMEDEDHFDVDDRVEIITGSGETQLRLGNGATGGAYIGSYGQNDSYIASGCEYNGSNWVARDTAAAIILITNASMAFYGQTGLTTGNTFTPTERMSITNAGKVDIGDAANADLIRIAGDTGNLSFLGDAGFYPRAVNQAAEPAAGTGSTQVDTGELIIWTDTDDSNRTYLVYNQASNILKVELT